MANTNDVIVLDAEKYPQVTVWGEKLGTQLGLEYFHLADEYFDYIPQHINHLRIDSKTATFGHKYWGEYRSQQSEYGESEEGTTQKDKVDVDRSCHQLHYSFYEGSSTPESTRNLRKKI